MPLPVAGALAGGSLRCLAWARQVASHCRTPSSSPCDAHPPADDRVLTGSLGAERQEAKGEDTGSPKAELLGLANPLHPFYSQLLPAGHRLLRTPGGHRHPFSVEEPPAHPRSTVSCSVSYPTPAVRSVPSGHRSRPLEWSSGM